MPAARRPLLVTLLCLAAPGAALHAATVVPLRALPGGLFVASVTLRGESLRMLVDTGATRSMVRPEIAARLHLKPRARFDLATTEGTAEGLCAGPLPVGLDGAELTVDCLGWSAGADAGALDAAVDGVLAADALGSRPILLDAEAGVLVLDPEPAATGAEVPLTLEAGRPALTVRRTDGSTLRLVLDTGAEDLVLFGRAAAAVRVRRPVALGTLTGWRRAGVGSAPRLAQLRRPPRQAVLLPDLVDRGEDGLLPLRAVGRVQLDWARGVAVLGGG